LAYAAQHVGRVRWRTLVADDNGLPEDRLVVDRAEQVRRDVRTRDPETAANCPVGVAANRSLRRTVGQLRRADDRPVQLARANEFLHPPRIRERLPQYTLKNRLHDVLRERPVPLAVNAGHADDQEPSYAGLPHRPRHAPGPIRQYGA